LNIIHNLPYILGLKSNRVPRALQLKFFQVGILFNTKFPLPLSSGIKIKGINLFEKNVY